MIRYRSAGEKTIGGVEQELLCYRQARDSTFNKNFNCRECSDRKIDFMQKMIMNDRSSSDDGMLVTYRPLVGVP